MKMKNDSNVRQIHLEKVTYDNVGRVVKLRVSKEQKNFVASNKWSLIQAYLTLAEEEPVYPFAIYNGDKVVGFIMLSYDNDWTGYEQEAWLNSDLYKEHEGRSYYYIWRFMIDKKYQNRGYGREALRLAIDFAKTSPCGDAEFCVLSYEPENTVAKKLYESFGFVEFTEAYHEGEEMYAVLKL